MSRLHKVDPTTIQSTKDFNVLERNSEGIPLAVKRIFDDTVWSLQDFVTNGTKMKGNITAFEFFVSEENAEIKCYVAHTWSKVGMNLESLIQVDDKLPSKFQVNQVVSFSINDVKHTCTVRAIRFTESKVRYDLDVWIDKDGGNSSTRIYNVDSFFVETLFILKP